MSYLRILEWFHIAMRFQNLGKFNSGEMNKLKDAAKWSLWYGKPKQFYNRIDGLIKEISDKKHLKKLTDLRAYIENNEDKIVNYAARKNAGLPFTSSTVESLINQRCKGKQHMQWSREGAQPILQIRAVEASNDWKLHWEEYVLRGLSKSRPVTHNIFRIPFRTAS
jgi:hypothetical protein